MTELMVCMGKITANDEDIDALVNYELKGIDTRSKLPKSMEDIRDYLVKKQDGSASSSASASKPPRTSAVLMDSSVVVNGDDEEFAEGHGLPSSSLTIPSAATTGSMVRKFLALLFTGVVGRDALLSLHLHARHNAKKQRLVDMVPFILKHCGDAADENEEEEVEQAAVEDLVREVLNSPVLLQELGCHFYVPFADTDSTNISSDGYCFYRAAFLLYIRATLYKYKLTAADMKDMDRGLLRDDTEIRRAFFKFFGQLEQALPEDCGRNKAKMAHMTFFSFQGLFLSREFWGCLDSVAFLPFPCTGFGAHSDPNFDGLAKFWCHSEFNTLMADIGTIPTLKEVMSIAKKVPNFLFHGTNHFFVTDTPEQKDFEAAFHRCMTSIMRIMRDRVRTCQRVLLSDGKDLGDVFVNVAEGSGDEENLILLSKVTDALKASISDHSLSYVDREVARKVSATDDDGSDIESKSSTIEDQIKLTKKFASKVLL